MCGIVGYIGKEQAAPILLEGLARLEYRGYDSAGICVAENGVLDVAKCKGRLKNLAAMTENGALLHGTAGIGHTRWATHGEPNDINSHPHVSQNGKVALVHNGIIENYLEIREFLEEKGVQFTSQTDSEVVAQLLEYCLGLDEVHCMQDAIYMVLHRIEGAYAFGIVCADDPERIYAARKDAPLLLGYGDGCNFIASDVTALVKYTRDVAYMEDGEVAVLTRDSIQVFNAMELPIEKEHHHVDWEISAAEKGGYPHFMLKEIMEQPEALRRAITPRVKDGRIDFGDLILSRQTIESFNRIMIVACGSSYHVGMLGKVHDGKADAHPGRGGLSLRVPVLRPDCRRQNACHRHQPVGRNARHHGGAARGKSARGAGAVDCQRGRKLDCARIGRRALHLGRTRDCRCHDEGILHAAGSH